MYLTTMKISTQDPYIQHQEVSRIFPKETGRVLFVSRNGGTIQVLSSVRGEDPAILSCREVALPEECEVIPFKIKYNPTKNVRERKGGKSHCRGILDSEEATEWLRKELVNKCGADVVALASTFQGTKRILKKGQIHAYVSQHTGVGVITVKDANLFMSSLGKGIGGAKFAGYGLLDMWYATQT
jgi:CRISPR-associated protein Cas6/Cse3/CasE subtype I-E